jgi:hypothetical protein
MRSSLSLPRLLGLGLLLAAVSCGHGGPKNQSSATILANPYNSKVRGNVYHSKWKNLELEFPTRTWRVEKGDYALHLVAKDKFSQVIVGSHFRLFNIGSVESRAKKLLKKLGMKSYEILTKDPTRLQGLDALVVTARGQFLVDRHRDLRVDRRVRALITKVGHRVIWMAYVSTEGAFPEYLPAVEQLQASLKILSQGDTTAVSERREQNARMDVAEGEAAGVDRPGAPWGSGAQDQDRGDAGSFVRLP